MLLSLALIFLSGMLLGAIFQKMKLPRLIGMLLTGIILGPQVYNLLDISVLLISPDLRQLALIIILTRAGLSLDIADLKKIGRPAILISFVPACLEMLGTVLLAPRFFQIPLMDAAILAAIVASASPAVLVPRMLQLMESGYGTNKKIPQLILAGDSVDDVLNITVFTSLLALQNGENVSFLRFAQIPVSVILGIAVGLLLGFFLYCLFRYMHVRDSAKVIIVLSIAFLLVAFEQWIEPVFLFSGLLSVMAAGVMLKKKSPSLAERLSNKFSKLWVGAEILLFVLVGASVQLDSVVSIGAKTILLLVAVLLMRALGILLCLIKTDLNRKERLFCTFTGIPKATVQAAIGAVPLAMGLPNGNLILAVAVLSILFTAPLGAFLIDATYKKLLVKTETPNGRAIL